MDFRKLVTDRHPSLTHRMLRCVLRLFSLPYAIGAECKNWAYRLGWKSPYRSSLPIVSVGNLSVGGTGKSPAVAWLAAWLRKQDLRVAILSRGYGALDSGQNDEALELELRLPDVPHLQHWDRIASAKLAEEELEMQVLVLDDGFQHRRIDRDVEIALVDATDPPSAYWPLPGGLLREPLYNLSRADIVLLTRSDQADQKQLAWARQLVKRYVADEHVFLAQHEASHLKCAHGDDISLLQLDGQQVLAFCGIGNPDSFFCTLAKCGAELVDTKTWPDHHGYEAADVAVLNDWAALHSDATLIVCTAKDWVKLQCEELGGKRLCALVIEMAIDRPEALQSSIQAKLEIARD
ncbi:MAG: tetraacyldisaccharide 4'-kinase [Aureliella sp.]